jgi:2-polyprenyl-3-methyl-5-hydroxy-6-metoxy-1,4-benzoquinol methylase
LEEFNVPAGTWPTGESAHRLHKWTAKTIRKVEKLIDRPRTQIRLLDVGCSSGAFVYAASKLGVQAEGVEPAEEPCKTATEKGLKVHQGYLEELGLPPESYHVVTLFEVLEHIKDPMSLLRESARILVNGGVVIIRTGNADSWTVGCLKDRWEYFSLSRHGGHVSFFTPGSMHRLSEESGFSVEMLNTNGLCFCQKHDAAFVVYRFFKIFSEILNIPAARFGKGHEMRVFLIKK